MEPDWDDYFEDVALTVSGAMYDIGGALEDLRDERGRLDRMPSRAWNGAMDDLREDIDEAIRVLRSLFASPADDG